MTTHTLSTYQSTLLVMRKALSVITDCPQLEAEILLAYALHETRSHIIAWPDKHIEPEQLAYIENLTAKRSQGIPIAYILGEREFWSHELVVNKYTLIPRPETECLVQLALQKIPQISEYAVLDMGTGCGAVAIAIASERPQCKITAIDISEKAISIAQQNASRLGINNITFIISDWYTHLAHQQYQIVVSNPPYIRENDSHLTQGDLRFEPKIALVAGKDGLDAIRTLVNDAHKYLVPGGWLIFEHGYDQGQAVRLLLQQASFGHVKTYQDLSIMDRVTCGQLM